MTQIPIVARTHSIVCIESTRQGKYSNGEKINGLSLGILKKCDFLLYECAVIVFSMIFDIFGRKLDYSGGSLRKKIDGAPKKYYFPAYLV